MRISLFSKSFTPLKGSNSLPKLFLFKPMASAFMVKSRRFWSSSKLPSSTMGLRDSLRYDSLRAPTNSTSISRYFICAVPKFLNTDRCASLPSFFCTASAKSIPLPRATISISLLILSKKISRTKPPITKASTPNSSAHCSISLNKGVFMCFTYILRQR